MMSEIGIKTLIANIKAFHEIIHLLLGARRDGQDADSRDSLGWGARIVVFRLGKGRLQRFLLVMTPEEEELARLEIDADVVHHRADTPDLLDVPFQRVRRLAPLLPEEPRPLVLAFGRQVLKIFDRHVIALDPRQVAEGRHRIARSVLDPIRIDAKDVDEPVPAFARFVTPISLRTHHPHRRHQLGRDVQKPRGVAVVLHARQDLKRRSVSHELLWEHPQRLVEDLRLESQQGVVTADSRPQEIARHVVPAIVVCVLAAEIIGHAPAVRA